jgi:drug/metabolite transporter (DMT)-like permease
MRNTVGWRTQFLILAATWGSSFLFIKVLGRHWPAVWVAFGRVALGALTLTALSLATRQRLRFAKGLWPHLAVAAILFNTVPFTLFAFGEKHVSSVIAGLWNATTPLWVLSGSMLAFPEEHPTNQRTVGLGLGFAGVIMLFGPWRGLGGGELLGHVACAGAALCYGIGFLYTRRHLAGRDVSGVALSAGQLLCATVMLALTLPFASAPTTHIGLDGVGSLLMLGVAGTGIAYVLNYAIVRAAGATIASTVTYVIPVFSTLLGVVVLGEQLSWNEPIGTLILLSGIAVSQGMPRRALAAASEAA